jgi:DNA-binding transcriptional LysR family regulator
MPPRGARALPLRRRNCWSVPVQSAAMSPTLKSISGSLYSIATTTKSPSLVPGSSITPASATALDAIEDASRQMEEGTSSRQVHVSTLPTFASRWLIPRLPKFAALHPKVDLQLSTGVAQIDEINFEYDAIDVATHFSISDIVAEHTDLLFETELQPVCSPELAQAGDGIAEAKDLLDQRPALYCQRANSLAAMVRGRRS